MRREIVAFPSHGLTLRGIVEWSEAPTTDGVLLLHGWGGYRVGPHGILRAAAEELTDQGLACLRFDFRGRGDSDGDVREHDLNSQIEDAKVAAQYMQETHGCERIYLIGICSGGEVAVGAMHDGLRVAGAALWSAPVFSAEATAGRKIRKSASYLGGYVRKVFRPATWRKLLAGRVRFDIIKRVLLGGGTHEKKEGERAEIAPDEALAGGADSVLLVYGTADPIAAEAIERYTGLFSRSGSAVRLERIEGANHGFYSGPWSRRVVELTAEWLREVRQAKT